MKAHEYTMSRYPYGNRTIGGGKTYSNAIVGSQFQGNNFIIYLPMQETLRKEQRFKQPQPPLEIPTEDEMRYSEIELTPDSVVEPLGDCRFRIDGRVLRFAIRKLTETE